MHRIFPIKYCVSQLKIENFTKNSTIFYLYRNAYFIPFIQRFEERRERKIISNVHWKSLKFLSPRICVRIEETHSAQSSTSIKFRIQNPFKRTRNEQANSVQEWCLRKRDRRTWFPNSKLNKRNNSSHCLFSRMNRGVSLPSFFKRLSINYSDKLSFSYFSRAGTMTADSIRNLKGFNTFGELEEENASVNARNGERTVTITR